MRVAVFEHDANPWIDLPALRISSKRAIDRVAKGFSFFVLNGAAIQNYPPDCDGENQSAGHEDWKVVHSSRLPRGESLRISTMQLVTQ